MFTGIIEATGFITEVGQAGTNKTFWVQSAISYELNVDQSVAHNGACLTVEEVKNGQHRVTAIEETLKKTNLGHWQAGTSINLERCLTFGGRIDGHLVQGHVDCIAVCKKIKERNGSWEYSFSFSEKFGALIIEKGSVCINGISLTAFEVRKKRFSVAIIPYTFEHTNIQFVKEGDTVNIEFDMLGKYIQKAIIV